MRFCQEHWDKLREEVQKQGLSAFVADTGEEMARKLAREINEEDGKTTIDTFDPLMAAHWALVANLSEAAGYPLIMIEGCPLCEGNQAHNEQCSDPDCIDTAYYDRWTVNAVQDQLEVLKYIQDH